MIQKIHVKNQILKSMDSLLKTEKSCGIFRFRKVNGHLVPIGRKLIAFMLIPRYLIIIAYIISVCIDNSLQIKSADIETISNFVHDTLNIVLVIEGALSITMFMWFLQENTILLNKLSDIDISLNIFGNSAFYYKARKYNRSFIFIYLTMYVVSYIFYFVLEEDFISTFEMLFLPIDCGCHYNTCAFYIFIKMLIDRLDILNKHLTNIIYFESANLFDFIKTHKNTDISGLKKNYLDYIIPETNNKIRRLSVAFIQIGEAHQLINEIFNFHVFATVLYTFINTIALLWISIMYYTNTSKINKVLDIVIQCWFEVSNIALLSFICEDLRFKRYNTKVLLNEIVMNYKLPKNMRIQAKELLELVAMWPLRVTAYNLFLIDTKLLLNFISISTTYLIIVLQFN